VLITTNNRIKVSRIKLRQENFIEYGSNPETKDELDIPIAYINPSENEHILKFV